MIRFNGAGNLSSKNAKAIEDAIVAKLRKDFNKSFNKQIKPIEDVTRSIITEGILESSAIESLLRGWLADYFGISTSTAQQMIKSLVDNITSKVKVTLINPTNRYQIANIKLLFLSLRVEELDNISKYISVGRYGGGPVHPLHDLLMLGTQVKIPFAQIKPEGFSRSGGELIQIPAKNKQPHRIPPNFAGTLTDNFLTRAALSKTNDLVDAILPLVLKSL